MRSFAAFSLLLVACASSRSPAPSPPAATATTTEATTVPPPSGVAGVAKGTRVREVDCWQFDLLAEDARPQRTNRIRLADAAPRLATGSWFTCRGLEPWPFPACRVVDAPEPELLEAACP
jgi:hypothetical protein